MQVEIDQLTALPNRASFFADLKAVLDPSIAIININRFRDINNLYGFDIGDTLLKEFAKLLSSKITDCSVYRTGGDQFLILNRTKSFDDFLHFVEKLQQLIRDHIFLESYFASNITTSIGVATGTNQLLNRAETALKKAVEKRLDLVVAGSSDEKSSTENLKMIVLIKQAVSQPWWIVPLFQPIVDAKTGRIVKYEALMRLRDQTGKLYSPFFFLELAKHSRYYEFLTRAMIKNTLKQFEHSEMGVTINLAVEDILHNETLDFLKNEIEAFGNPSQITLEITETDEIENYQKVLDSLEVFRKLGVTIAIDDFGSGYSNFAYIIQFQADFLKIDGSIVQKIVEDEKSFETLRAIVDFAKRMGIATVAEFISSKEIAEKAIEAGVDYLQGYYLGEPAALQN